MERQVLIEWRGQDRPALIWAGRRAWEQWLGPETTDRMGVKRLAMFWAEQIGPTWHIGAPCEPEPGAKAALLDVARTSGRILPPRTPTQQRSIEKAAAALTSEFVKRSKAKGRQPPRTKNGKALLTPGGKY